MRNLSVTDVKKPASEEDLEIYSYVVANATKIAGKIINLIAKSPMNEGGLVFVTGPQNSGKSIVVCELCRLAEEKKIGRTFTAAQPRVDRPDVPEGEVYSRSGMVCVAESFSTRAEIEGIFHNNSFVIVDEVQFIPYELQSYYLKEVAQFVERGGWLVNIGLLYTSVQTEFLLSSILYSRSQYTYELLATCQMCGRNNATRNQRLVKGRSASSDAPELEPPSEEVAYEPRCLDCLNI